MASGKLAMQDSALSSTPIKSALWALFVTHFREPHDYVKHRMMHPWKWRWLEKAGLPDPGRFLYRHVHSLHHKSINTTAFSGTSMHPIEATAYYSAALLPFCLPWSVHPVIPLAIVIDCGFGAWLGHGGFIFPGTGDYFHNIHHLMFDANYGTINIGLDWVFAAREEDVTKIWKGQKSGLEDNETPTFS